MPNSGQDRVDGRVQVLLVQIPSEIARKAKELVGSEAPYGSLSELVVTALQNQLLLHGLTMPEQPAAVKGDGQLALGGPVSTRESGDLNKASHLLSPPSAPPDDLLSDDRFSGHDRLFLLTNRLAPLKIAARVLANLRLRDGRWPQVELFRVEAAANARALGLQLREDDERRGTRGSARRAIGFPVGPDAEKAMNRYTDSFTLATEGGGPMAVLGVADAREGQAVLTAAGWKLAAALTPLLGEIHGESMSIEERQILVERLFRASSELDATCKFLSGLHEVGYSQSKIDQLLAGRNPRWSRNRIVAERASMVGRLKDLGLVTAGGRGGDAQILMTTDGEELLGMFLTGEILAGSEGARWEH